MRYNFLGSDAYVVQLMFRAQDGFVFDTLSASGSRVVERSRVDPEVTFIFDGNFQTSNGTVTGGAIHSISIEKAGVPQVSIADVDWSYSDFINAVLAGLNSNNFQPFANLLSASGTVFVDAQNAQAGFDLSGSWDAIPELLNQSISFTGSPFGDRFMGSLYDDSINPGYNSSSIDVVFSTIGNDTIDFSAADRQTKYYLQYGDDFSPSDTPIAVTIDSLQNTGSIVWGEYTHTLLNVTGALSSDYDADRLGSLSINGTTANDTFNIRLKVFCV